MAITNHVTGRVSSLSRPPPKSGSGAAFDASFIIPVALVLASSDAATALIDPSLPRAIAIGAATAVAIGGATNAFLLPRLNQVHSLHLSLCIHCTRRISMELVRIVRIPE